MSTVSMYRHLAPTLPRFDTDVSDNEILALWSAGRDTYDIALQVGLPESQVANRLPRILERRRVEFEWDRASENPRQRCLIRNSAGA